LTHRLHAGRNSPAAPARAAPGAKGFSPMPRRVRAATLTGAAARPGAGWQWGHRMNAVTQNSA